MIRYPRIELDGAVVAVTGAGRGIGQATAEAFARHGAIVYGGDLDPTTAEYHLDVADHASYEAFVTAVLKRAGRIDVLVNNAGVMPLGGFLDEPDAISRTTLDVNVWGLIHGMRLVLPAMLERGRGHLVNIASMAGKIAFPGMAVYNASKFAAVGLSAAVRDELVGTGVSVSTVLPSAVRTGLSSGVPFGRGLPVVEPETVAAAVVRSVRTRRAEIPVPGYLAAWNRGQALMPQPLLRMVMRLADNRRALDAVDHSARAAYEAGIADQAARR